MNSDQYIWLGCALNMMCKFGSKCPIIVKTKGAHHVSSYQIDISRFRDN